MIAYIDSSVLLRILLRHEARLVESVNYSKLYSLELMETECLRTLHRYRLQGQLDDETLAEHLKLLYELLAGLYIIPLSHSIIRQAGQAFATIIGTLDALHLSAAMELFQVHEKQSRTLLTHDTQLGRAARAMGITVLGVT